MSEFRERALARLKRFRRHPVQFVHEEFHVEPDAWQVDALEPLGGDYNPRRRVAMKACTGPGKSTVEAWAGWHRLMCFGSKGEHPKGAALSGEGRDNLRDNLWAELSKWQQRSELLKREFTWNKERIYANSNPETWFLAARSYARDADEAAIGQSLSGLHSKYPFILLDETGGMPVAIGQKAEQIFTGEPVDALIMQAGNPTSNDGLLYQTCTTLKDLYKIITITADPDDPKRTPRVDIEHAREQIARYGRDNPWVMSTILGLFPPSSLNKLLGPDDVDAAMGRHLTIDKYDFAQRRLGIDVARFGDDRTIIFPRQGLAAFKYVEMRNARTPEIAARVMKAKADWGSELEFVDGTGGFGAGVIDSLIQAGQVPQEIHFAGKAIDPRYLNIRAEMWFNMAAWVKRGGALPTDPGLAKELTAPTYFFQNGKFQLESKDQIKARLGFSPDVADALCLTFAMPEMPKADSLEGLKTTSAKLLSDYDPYAADRF